MPAGLERDLVLFPVGTLAKDTPEGRAKIREEIATKLGLESPLTDDAPEAMA